MRMLSLCQLCGATTLLLSGQVALAELGIQAQNVGMSSKIPRP
jgi:mannan endo-1,6-alpha-mannosidase